MFRLMVIRIIISREDDWEKKFISENFDGTWVIYKTFRPFYLPPIGFKLEIQKKIPLDFSKFYITEAFLQRG